MQQLLTAFCPRQLHAAAMPAVNLATVLATLDEALLWGMANPVSWLVVCGCGGVVLHGLYCRRLPGPADLLVFYILYSTLSGSDAD